MEQQDDKGMPGESYISGPFHQAITQKEKTFDLWRSTGAYLLPQGGWQTV